MKPSMLFAIVALTAIVMVSSFGLQLSSTTPITVPAGTEGIALYVCPVASPSWDAIATAMRPFHRFISIIIFSAAMILMFVWGWTLYQNLLKDKLETSSFSKPWQLTKVLFWFCILVLMAWVTPNHFRKVRIDGANGDWVLCENTTPGARAVRASNVHR